MEKKEKQNSVDTDVSEISRLIKLYEEANSWFTKRQIPSVFVNDYSKVELQLLIPGVSIWTIDEVRRHAAKVRVGKSVPQMETITRARLDSSKVDHFLDSYTSSTVRKPVSFHMGGLPSSVFSMGKPVC